MSYLITNQQKRAFIVSALVDLSNSEQKVLFESVTIDPGATEVVHAEHWDRVRKGNTVIEALLSGRHLVVNKGQDPSKAPEVRELHNPAPPKAPEDLTGETPGATITSKTDVHEVTLTPPPGEPTAAPAPARSTRRA